MFYIADVVTAFNLIRPTNYAEKLLSDAEKRLCRIHSREWLRPSSNVFPPDLICTELVLYFRQYDP